VERGTRTGCAGGANDMRLRHERWKLAPLLLSSNRPIGAGEPNHCEIFYGNGSLFRLSYAFCHQSYQTFHVTVTALTALYTGPGLSLG
jgi:hypothetical protein